MNVQFCVFYTLKLVHSPTCDLAGTHRNSSIVFILEVMCVKIMLRQAQLPDSDISIRQWDTFYYMKQYKHHRGKQNNPNKPKVGQMTHFTPTLWLGCKKNNFVASRKHMKKCQFWKMPSLKGKSKCQGDRSFTHRERCLLGVTQEGVRIIFFPSWDELQLPGIKHTKQRAHCCTPIAWRAAWSQSAALLGKSKERWNNKYQRMSHKKCSFFMSQWKISDVSML